MVELFLAEENLPFAVSLGLMLAIGFLEGLGMVLGLAFSGILEQIVPDIDVDGDVDLDSSVLTALLGWLHIGKVPLLVLLIIFLTGFGLSGLIIQGSLHGISGFYLPAALASIPAFFVALMTVRTLGSGMARIIPQDETAAVSQDTFIGRLAEITQGTARQGLAAEARLKDEHGNIHYVMVEPDLVDEVFTAGNKVLLVRRQGISFKVITAPASITE
jgi:hypothetical protein